MTEIPTQVQNIINQAGGFHLTGSLSIRFQVPS